MNLVEENEYRVCAADNHSHIHDYYIFVPHFCLHSQVGFNASLPEEVLSTSITVASLTDNTEELTTDAVDFASTAIFNLVAAVSKDEVLNQTVGKEVRRTRTL